MKFKIPLLIIKTLQALEKKGFSAYIVGGPVRNLIMKRSTHNWDFTSNAKPEEIQKVFPESFYDNKFGTVGITAEELVKQFQPEADRPLDEKDYKPSDLDGKPSDLDGRDVFEITTFRSEKGYVDRRHPDKVTWGKSLKNDLKRRDFTINAIALRRAQGKLDWKIVDPYKGQEDIKNKLIKAVGDPNERFSEDALRMMRAIRIGAELGFTIEEKTLNAINKNSSLINQISKERVRDELFKLLKSDFPAEGIKLMFLSGLLEHILPELIKAQNVEQAGHHTKDVWNHCLDSLAECPSPHPVIRLATLLHDVGKPIAFRQTQGKITFYGHEVVGGRIVKKIADRLRFSKKDKEKLWLLVRYHMFAYEPKMTDAAIRRFIKRVGKENINDMMMLRIGDRKGGGSKATSWRLRELQERIGKVMYTPMQVSDLKINGSDVMKILGIKSGPKVGEILKKLFEEVMENSGKNKREYLLKKIKELKSKKITPEEQSQK